MADQHIKSAVSKTQGKAEELLGKVTGDKEQEARGKARQGKGEVQDLLGDVQDTAREIRRPS